MAAFKDLYNLTPHEIVVFTDTTGKTVSARIACHGVLRLASVPVVSMPSPDPRIPLVSGQTFTGIDTTGSGYAMWCANPMGHFIVSLPMAQFLTGTVAGRRETGQRHIYCPASGRGYDVRDEGGRLLGCTALEQHS